MSSATSQSFDDDADGLPATFVARRYAVRSDPSPCIFLEYEDDAHKRRVRAVRYLALRRSLYLRTRCCRLQHCFQAVRCLSHIRIRLRTAHQRPSFALQVKVNRCSEDVDIDALTHKVPLPACPLTDTPRRLLLPCRSGISPETMRSLGAQQLHCIAVLYIKGFILPTCCSPARR